MTYVCTVKKQVDELPSKNQALCAFCITCIVFGVCCFVLICCILCVS